MRTCIISFSSRAGGNCARIAEQIRSFSEGAVLYDFSRFAIHPCGGCNYECFSSRDKCPHIADMAYELLDAVTHSAITYLILPNYCDYPCANFFIFNERSQCYFQGRPELLDAYEKVPKRIVVVSNTNEGNFRQAMAYHCAAEPDILFLSAKKYGKVSVKGDLLTSADAVADLAAWIQAPASPEKWAAAPNT